MLSAEAQKLRDSLCAVKIMYLIGLTQQNMFNISVAHHLGKHSYFSDVNVFKHFDRYDLVSQMSWETIWYHPKLDPSVALMTSNFISAAPHLK